MLGAMHVGGLQTVSGAAGSEPPQAHARRACQPSCWGRNRAGVEGLGAISRGAVFWVHVGRSLCFCPNRQLSDTSLTSTWAGRGFVLVEGAWGLGAVVLEMWPQTRNLSIT